MTDASKELLANIPPFGLRMQADLKERIKKAAEANNRSMNAEIVAALENAYPKAGKLTDAEKDVLWEYLQKGELTDRLARMEEGMKRVEEALQSMPNPHDLLKPRGDEDTGGEK